MPRLEGKRIAILATNGFEQSELEVPLEKLKEAGATVDIVSPESGEIKGWEKKNWGRPVKVDRTLSDASPDDYDALVLPGGVINPDTLRINKDALVFIGGFYQSQKVIAAICHAPWLLIEAGIARGRDMTSYKSVLTDLKNAGANILDQEVVSDEGIVTSRTPRDLTAFCAKIVEEIAEGRHYQRAA